MERPYRIRLTKNLPSTAVSTRSRPPVPDFSSALLAAAKRASTDTPQNTLARPAASGNSARVGRATGRSAAAPPKRLASEEQWQLDTIVLDAGHGGWDKGAVSRSGTAEKDLTLDMVRTVASILRRELGINVVLTRSNDTFIPLAERGHIANSAGGKLFISIHANQSSSRGASGTETYFLGTHRSDSARVVMERENEVVALEDNRGQYEGLTPEEIARRRLTQSSNLRHSERLAALIEESFRSNAQRNSRGVKQAGFYVLFGASMPAVLVELGFLSNSREADYLSSAEGHTQLANSIVDAIRAFKQEYERVLKVASIQ